MSISASRGISGAASLVGTELARSQDRGIVLMDSSSLIDMYRNGVDVKGNLYTIPAIKDEMGILAVTGKMGMKAVDAVQQLPPSASRPSLTPQQRMTVREDILKAYAQTCSEKKQTVDPISGPDLALATQAVTLAMQGERVTLATEDEHLYKPVQYLLENGYSRLAPSLGIMRVRGLLGSQRR